MAKAVRAIVIHDNKLLVMKRNKFGLKYYTLIGGGINVGESAEAALRREVQEETGLSLGAVSHVFTEEAGDPYGTQYVFMCEYQGGDPVLQPNSDEAHIAQLGKNLYEPMWLPVAKLKTAPFVSESLRLAIIDGLKSGFPKTPKELAWKQLSVASLRERK